MKRLVAALFLVLLTLPAFAQPIESFDGFIANFRSKALAAGVSGAVYDAAMGGLSPDPRVPDLVSSQPEFTTPMWDYIEGRVTPGRVERGRARPMASIPISWAPSGAWRPITAPCSATPT